MRINRDKAIGTVIFIVEGQQFEFSLLAKIFQDVLGYEYCSRKRGKRGYYKRGNNLRSKVYVFNAKNSNMQSIMDDEFMDELYMELTESLNVDVENASIFFLFDRDPKSNKLKDQHNRMTGKYISYEQLHEKFKDPLENKDTFIGGQLLLSYPSVESYLINCFDRQYSSELLTLGLGKDLKAYINDQEHRKDMQINKLNEKAIEQATIEFLKYLKSVDLVFSMDEVTDLPKQIFILQEQFYQENNHTYRLISLLTIALIELGIIILEASDECYDIVIPSQF